MNIRLEDLGIYKSAMEIGRIVYDMVLPWNYFDKNTLDKQLVRAADSIALNIAEGYGRFYYKENKNFCYYSRGSAKETVAAVEKALQRKLITREQFQLLSEKLHLYFRLSFSYIQSIGTRKDSE